MPSLAQSHVASYQQQAVYMRTITVPFLQLDQNGHEILPVAQTCHANYEKQPVFMEKITFHDRIHHYGVSWNVTSY